MGTRPAGDGISRIRSLGHVRCRSQKRLIRPGLSLGNARSSGSSVARAGRYDRRHVSSIRWYGAHRHQRRRHQRQRHDLDAGWSVSRVRQSPRHLVWTWVGPTERAVGSTSVTNTQNKMDRADSVGSFIEVASTALAGITEPLWRPFVHMKLPKMPQPHKSSK
jgi:hypothetical protein